MCVLLFKGYDKGHKKEVNQEKMIVFFSFFICCTIRYTCSFYGKMNVKKIAFGNKEHTST